MRKRSQFGTTIIEIVAVTGIIMALAALAIPNMNRIIADIRLRSAANSVGSLLQQARMRSVRDNKFYPVIPAAALQGAFSRACIDTNWNGQCENGEPMIQLPQSTTLAAGAGVPGTAPITCGPNGPAPCAGAGTGLNFVPEPPTVLPTFNSRGLPCVGNPSNVEPQWPAAGCFSSDQAGTPGGPGAGGAVGFLYVFQYNAAFGVQYAAVVVTPAGRVTTWMWRGRDAGGNDVWSR